MPFGWVHGDFRAGRQVIRPPTRACGDCRWCVLVKVRFLVAVSFGLRFDEHGLTIGICVFGR